MWLHQINLDKSIHSSNVFFSFFLSFKSEIFFFLIKKVLYFHTNQIKYQIWKQYDECKCGFFFSLLEKHLYEHLFIYLFYLFVCLFLCVCTVMVLTLIIHCLGERTLLLHLKSRIRISGCNFLGSVIMQIETDENFALQWSRKISN